MASQQKLLTMGPGPGGAQGYVSLLPIPFMNGKPTDIRVMNIDELKKFINFMYRSAYSSKLPISFKNRHGMVVPKWWLESITFDRFLTLKGPASGNQRISDHKHQLEDLIRACYLAQGMSSLLAIGAEFANNNPSKRIYLDKESKESITKKVVDWTGRTVAIVDSMTLSCNVNHPRKLRDRSSIDKGGYSDGTENSLENGPAVSIRSSKSKLSSISVSDYQCDERNQHKPSSHVAVTGKKGNNKTEKKVTKRKLFEFEDGKAAECKYCGKSFRLEEFCEEHEEACDKGPNAGVTLQGFMNSLGLRARSQVTEMAAANQLVPRSSRSDPERVGPSTMAAPVRSLRKLPKRNQLLSMIRTNAYPLTTERGKNMLAELGDTAEKTFPPPYERDCHPRKGSVPEKRFPNVMKKAIGKDVENAHVYSFGRKQRLEHYQELVVGLNHKSWKALNKCRKPRLVLEKMKPTHGTLQLGDNNATRKTHLERQFAAAIELPLVRVTDFRKLANPDPIIAKFLAKEKKKKEAKVQKESLPSDNDSFNSSCSSSDSLATLLLVAVKPNKGL